MKDHKTMIIVSVRAPTILEADKLADMKTIIFNRVVAPLKCETRVHYAVDKHNSKILNFYIFKEGKLKNSMREKLEAIMSKLGLYWKAMLGWQVMTVDKMDDI